MSGPISPNGYTLIDMLAALLILGLAMAGFGQGMFALSRLQLATSRTLEETHRGGGAQSLLARYLADPSITSERMSGGPGRLMLHCRTAPCSAEIAAEDGASVLTVARGDLTSVAALPQPAPARFGYVTDQGLAETWPIPDRRLLAIQIQGADGRVLAYHRLWRQQSLDCAFDPVSRRCPTSP